eukprot:508905_1
MSQQPAISIHFGTFGFSAAFSSPPFLSPRVIDWSNHSQSLLLNINLASLLVDKHTNETVAFGYEARDLYAKFKDNKTNDKYMYFDNFNEYLNGQTNYVSAANNNGILSLSDLIIKCFIAIMQQCISHINDLNSRLAGFENINEKEVCWLVLMPSKFDKRNTCMIEKCATTAGMNNFEMVRESTAPIFHPDITAKFRDKENIMILDCGGNTTQATVIKINSKWLQTSEIMYCDHVAVGSEDVDKEFMNVLQKLLPEEVTCSAVQWIRQKEKFQSSKCHYPTEFPSDLQSWNVEFCFYIKSFLVKMRKKRKTKYKELRSIISKYEIMQRFDTEDEEKDCALPSFTLRRSVLAISKNGWLDLHENTFQKIVKFVNSVFDQFVSAQCNKIILVGGFSNSGHLQKRLLKEFSNKEIIIIRNPHLAHIKGVLHYFNKPKPQISRSKYSYGIAVDRRWTSVKHPVKRKVKDIHLGSIIKNAFSPFLQRNQQYEDGYTEEFDYWIPEMADHLEIFLYASEDSFCRYVYNEDGKTFPNKEGKRVFAVKKFKLKLMKINQKKTIFKLKLEYKQSGINLSFINPNDNKVRKVNIDITTVKPNNKSNETQQLN